MLPSLAMGTCWRKWIPRIAVFFIVFMACVDGCAPPGFVSSQDPCKLNETNNHLLRAI